VSTVFNTLLQGKIYEKTLWLFFTMFLTKMLVDGAITILKNMKVNGIIPYIMEHKKCVKTTNQPSINRP